MQVVPINTSTDYQQQSTLSVSKKGQITLPKFIRDRLGIRSADKISLKLVQGNTIAIEKIPSSIDESYQVIPPLKKPLSLQEMVTQAREEHVVFPRS